MLRRMFMKGLLSSPIALLGGKEEQFVLPMSNAVICNSENSETYWYGTNKENEGKKFIQFPKGKWQATEMTFTRVREKP